MVMFAVSCGASVMLLGIVIAPVGPVVDEVPAQPWTMPPPAVESVPFTSSWKFPARV